MSSKKRNRPKKGMKASPSTIWHMDSPVMNSQTSTCLSKTLSEDEVNMEFEIMLDNMNLSDDKREPLTGLPMMKKREMLAMNNKTQGNSKQTHDSPSDYIQMLSNPELSLDRKLQSMESLRVALTSNNLVWVQEFGNNGLEQLLQVLNVCFEDKYGCHKLHLESIKCLKAIMNNKLGLQSLSNHREVLVSLARSMDPNYPSVALEAVKLLAAVCFVPPDGHEKILEAITIAAEVNGDERFGPIIVGLRICNNEPLKVSCLTLINALLSCPDDLDFRMHLRNEFMRGGLFDVLEAIENSGCEEFQLQLKVFIDHKEEDFDEFAHRFDNIRVEFDEVDDVYDMVKNSVLNTAAEPYFLSILQHLLYIRDDYYARPAYFKLVEECVSQIVLHKSGFDPDFRATKRFEIDVEPLVEQLLERSRVEDVNSTSSSNCGCGMAPGLEAAVTEKQELEVRLTQALQRISELESSKISGVNCPSTSLANSAAPPPPPPPPPLPACPVVLPSSKPKGLSSGGSVPPPPPPPPPLKDVSLSRGPPTSCTASGAPMPPPPPPTLPQIPAATDIFTKLGIKKKKKWMLAGGMKRTNWKSIPLSSLTKNAFWVNLDEERLVSDELVENLQTRFSTKTVVKRSETDSGSNSGKRLKQLKVLDAKAAQNLSVILGGVFKHISYADSRKLILQCDTSILTENLVQSLVQYLPNQEQLKRLSNYREDFNDLSEPEQFALSLSDIKRLGPRLTSMMFRLQFPEFIRDCRPDIVAATAACEEVRKSGKFARLLEIILLFGNIMNSGSRNEQAVGFDISYLPKLVNTKDYENKWTLMHFLIETIEFQYPELLNFHEEMLHVDKAARVSCESIERVMKQVELSLRKLENEILLVSGGQVDEEDLFVESMGAFVSEAKQQFSLLTAMSSKMESLYGGLAEYYVFDVKKYGLEDFFGDLKNFKDKFKQAHNAVVKDREIQVRLKTAEEAKERAQREKEERKEKAKANILVDFSVDDNKSGVMDSLLEALKTGTAFSREVRRKRSSRPAGAQRRARLSREYSRERLSTSSSLDAFASDVVVDLDAYQSDSSTDVAMSDNVYYDPNESVKRSLNSDALMRKLRAL